MRTLITATLMLAMSLCCFAEGNVVQEAQSALAKKQHEAMVDHAKTLLERKTKLEAALAATNAKLAQLESGKDVKVGAEPDTDEPATGYWQQVNPTPGCYYCGGVTWTTQPHN